MSAEIVGTSRGSRRDEAEVSRACGETSIFDKVKPAISHSDYRVLVTRAALRSAQVRGAGAPATRDFARAKNAVDKALVDRGLGIKIPHARPGRVTR